MSGVSTAGAPARPLSALLAPAAVAVIGASRDPTKRGYHIVRALLEAEYAGRIHPVNPAGGELLGLAVATAIGGIDPAPDLAVLCTPASTVPALLEECAQAGVRAAVALAVGFAESGAAGAELESAVQDVVRRTGIRLVGPNTSGLLNVRLGLNLIGMRGVPAGPLALIAQSGNLVLQTITEAQARSDSGFSCCIGVGNQTDVRIDELMAELQHDENTRAILVHAEGFRDGAAFLQAARSIAPRKPVVLLKGARSATGSAVARSHTGAVAGEYAVLRAALRQCGVQEVTRTDELFHVGETLASQPPLGRKGLAILSDGGGHATLAADALSGQVRFATLSSAGRAALRALLGRAAAVDNPIDLAGAADADPLVFARTLDVLAREDDVGAVLVVGLFGGYALRFADSLLPAECAAAAALAERARAGGVGLIVHSLFAATRSQPLRALTRAGVPVIESLDVACRCVVALAERGAALERLRPLPAQDAEPALRQNAETIVKRALADGRSVLLEPEARDLLAAAGVPVVRGTFCRSAEEATDVARALGAPVVLKAVSPQAPHKTDAGGVVVNVEPADVAARFAEITTSVASYCRERGLPADVRGVLVTPMLPAPVAELLVGCRRDAQYGFVLALGAGGTLVEVMRDVSLRVLPVDAQDVHAMLAELAIAPILDGVRGRPRVDRSAIVQAALALAAAASATPGCESLEINPLFVYADRAVAVDARVYLQGELG